MRARTKFSCRSKSHQLCHALLRHRVSGSRCCVRLPIGISPCRLEIFLIRGGMVITKRRFRKRIAGTDHAPLDWGLQPDTRILEVARYRGQPMKSMKTATTEAVVIPAGAVTLDGDLRVPAEAKGLVIFATRHLPAAVARPLL